jgi:hypothetical protein
MSTPLIFQQENAPIQGGGSKPLIFGGTPEPIIFKPQPVQQIQLEDNRSWLQKGIGAVGNAINNAVGKVKTSVESHIQPPEVREANFNTFVEYQTTKSAQAKVAEAEINVAKDEAKTLDALKTAYKGLPNKDVLSPSEMGLLQEKGYLDKDGNIKRGKMSVEGVKSVVTALALFFPEVFTPVTSLAKLATGGKAINILGKSVPIAEVVAGTVISGTYNTLYTPNLEDIFTDPAVTGEAGKRWLVGAGIGAVVSFPLAFVKAPVIPAFQRMSPAEQEELKTIYLSLAKRFHPNSMLPGASDKAWVEVQNKYNAADIKWMRELNGTTKPAEVEKLLGQTIPTTAQPEAKQLPSTEATKVPGKGTIEQIAEQKGGWNPSDRVKFDTAMLEKDAQTVKKMLPVVPKEYQQRFSKEIESLVGETPVTPRVRESLKLPNPPEESPVTPKVGELYHGSDNGNLKVDNNGNINLTTEKTGADTFGKTLNIDTSGMKVETFDTKEEVFKIARTLELKQDLLDKGVDIIGAENHYIAINPAKLSQETGNPLREGILTKKISDVTQLPQKPSAQGVVEPAVQESRGDSSKVIADNENTIKKVYSDNKEVVYDALSQIFTEMEVAQAGSRVRMENGETVGFSSTFPAWVPETLRSKDLFDKVLSGITDIENIKFPDGNKSAQRSLYNEILQEIDRSTGLDTSENRTAIIDAYENIKQTPKALPRSATGSKEPKSKEVEKNVTLKPIGTGEKKLSTLGVGVEQKAVEKKLIESLADLPEYKQVNMKDQAEKALKLIETDPELATNVALGKENSPRGLLPEAVFTAVEEKAVREGSIDLITQLAKSTLVSQATAMGQRIRALAERNTDSPVNAIRQVIEDRKKALEEKFKQPIAKTREKIVRQIKSKIKTPNKADWNSFIDSIEC